MVIAMAMASQPTQPCISLKQCQPSDQHQLKNNTIQWAARPDEWWEEKENEMNALIIHDNFLETYLFYIEYINTA